MRGGDGGLGKITVNHSVGVAEGWKWVGREAGTCVLLPDCGRLQTPAKEFRVVFVRQWVEWKDLGQERLWALARLIQQQCVGWD